MAARRESVLPLFYLGAAAGAEEVIESEEDKWFIRQAFGRRGSGVELPQVYREGHSE